MDVDNLLSDQLVIKILTSSYAILTPKGKTDKEKLTSEVLRYPEECL